MRMPHPRTRAHIHVRAHLVTRRGGVSWWRCGSIGSPATATTHVTNIYSMHRRDARSEADDLRDGMAKLQRHIASIEEARNTGTER